MVISLKIGQSAAKSPQEERRSETIQQVKETEVLTSEGEQ